MWTLARSPHLWATPCPVPCWGHSQGQGDCASCEVGGSGGQDEGPGPPQNIAPGGSCHRQRHEWVCAWGRWAPSSRKATGEHEAFAQSLAEREPQENT